ncbi:hypothetical protein HK27_08655 [Acetobacter orientalis]|nr:hypothetical protein HK27_08655 [Acetobacter orientalis]
MPPAKLYAFPKSCFKRADLNGWLGIFVSNASSFTSKLLQNRRKKHQMQTAKAPRQRTAIFEATT